MSNNMSMTAFKAVLKTHEESLKKTRLVMEKRGKSHVRKVNRVFQSIAIDDIDYVRDKLANLEDKETTIVEERIEVVDTLFED